MRVRLLVASSHWTLHLPTGPCHPPIGSLPSPHLSFYTLSSSLHLHQSLALVAATPTNLGYSDQITEAILENPSTHSDVCVTGVRRSIDSRIQNIISGRFCANSTARPRP